MHIHLLALLGKQFYWCQNSFLVGWLTFTSSMVISFCFAGSAWWPLCNRCNLHYPVRILHLKRLKVILKGAPRPYLYLELDPRGPRLLVASIANSNPIISTKTTSIEQALWGLRDLGWVSHPGSCRVRSVQLVELVQRWNTSGGQAGEVEGGRSWARAAERRTRNRVEAQVWQASCGIHLAAPTNSIFLKRERVWWRSLEWHYK